MERLGFTKNGSPINNPPSSVGEADGRRGRQTTAELVVGVAGADEMGLLTCRSGYCG